MTTATLQEWQRRWDDPDDRLAPRPLGAPALAATPAQRREIRDFLALFGSALPVATLQDHFPTISRRDLACLLHLARRDDHDRATAAWYHAVTWHGPGAIWAMDHTEPPTPIDGRYRFILTVRDLASGATLAAHAVEHPDADSTIALLDDLRARHGAPLIIKADNGSAFIAQHTRTYLATHRIALLRSPPSCPSYNGACEAGNGTIKRYAHAIAARHDRPHTWTLDDLEAARLLANQRITERHQTLTPQQRLDQALPIPDAQRQTLTSAIHTARERRRAQHAIAQHNQARTLPGDALERQAITDALQGLGSITIRSKPVRLCNPQRDVV